VPRHLAIIVVFASLAVAPPAARGVVIQTLSGTDNTSAPLDDPGWLNVSFRGNGSAVYLGNGWVLTANHTTGGSMTFNGQTFSEVPGSAFLLSNNDVPDRTATTDLKLLRIDGIPTGVSDLPIAATTPALGTPVVMIGAGRDRGAFTQWTVNQTTTPWTWTEVSSGGNFGGFQTLGTRALRWGTNNVELINQWIFFEGRDVYTMATGFDFEFGTSEAQAVFGDSGGAVFAKNGSQWELAGIMTAVAGFSGQPNPGFTPVFGNATFMADLSFYREQIVAVVPEPGGAALVVVALGMAGAWAALRRRGA
jgi:hypothetical protein